MLKKILLLLLPAAANAHMLLRCPTVTEVQFGGYTDWQPVYTSSQERADYDDVNRFEQSVTAFQTARWSSSYLKQAHCHYTGDDPISNTITLAHYASYPLQSADWRWLQPDRLAECHDDPFACQFIY